MTQEYLLVGAFVLSYIQHCCRCPETSTCMFSNVTLRPSCSLGMLRCRSARGLSVLLGCCLQQKQTASVFELPLLESSPRPKRVTKLRGITCRTRHPLLLFRDAPRLSPRKKVILHPPFVYLFYANTEKPHPFLTFPSVNPSIRSFV